MYLKEDYMNNSIIKSAVLLALLGNSAVSTANEYTDITSVDGVTISDTNTVTHSAFGDGELTFSINAGFNAIVPVTGNLMTDPYLRFRYRTSLDGEVGRDADTFRYYFKLIATNADGSVEIESAGQTPYWLAKTDSAEWTTARTIDADGYEFREQDLSSRVAEIITTIEAGGLSVDDFAITQVKIVDGAARYYFGDVFFDYFRAGSHSINVGETTTIAATDAGGTQWNDPAFTEFLAGVSAINAGADGSVTTVTHDAEATGTFTLGDAVDLTFTADGDSALTKTTSVTVMDLTAPVINVLPDVELSLNQDWTEPGTTADDNVDGVIVATATAFGDVVDTAVSKIYYVDYNAVDAAGNMATPVQRIVTVGSVAADETKPVITLIEGDLTYIVGQAYEEFGATATDTVGDDTNDMTADIVIDASAVDNLSVGVYTVTYNVSDASDNDAVTVKRTVTFMADEVKPVIILEGGAVTLSYGEYYDDPGATATDNIDGDVDVNIDASAIDNTTKGTYTVTYNATDASGNNAEQLTREVTVESRSDARGGSFGSSIMLLLAGIIGLRRKVKAK